MTATPSPEQTGPATGPATSPATAASDDATTVVDAAQAALAGEHACVYGYGVVGAHVDGQAQETARDHLVAHEEQRESLGRHLLALDAEPVASLGAYTLPFPVDGDESARELAGVLEDRLAGLYVDLVGSGPEPELRELAARALISTAVRRTRWTGETSPFPGLDGRAGGPAPDD